MNIKSSKSNICRRKFLYTFGTALTTGGIVGVSVVSLFKSAHKRVSIDEQFAYVESPATIPYKQTTSFDVDGNINGFELLDDKLIVATQNNIHIYNSSGIILGDFAVRSDLRDIAVYDGRIFLLFPERIEVCTMDGEPICQWEAYNNYSDYCSFTVASDAVFVTDAANKEICKYGTDGSFKKIIKSPNRFIITSYTFGIIILDDVIYCSNSGRHQVELFTTDGEYLGAWGQPGVTAGRFGGCCNPVHLTCTPNGDIITSEKGNTQISCYGRDGQFRNILLDSKALGGGNKAYEVKTLGEKLFVAGKNRVSVFQYDNNV